MDHVSTGVAQAVYYRHSGRFSGAGLMVTLLVGVLVAMVLGAVYALIDLYNPIAGWVTFLVTGGTGWALGVVMGMGIKAGKIRNVGLAMLLTTIAVAVLCWVSWEVWLYAFLQRAARGNAPLQISFWDLLLHPQMAWDLVVAINQAGAWKIGTGPAPTGMFLAAVWVGEAAILCSLPLFVAYLAVTARPFCEHCDKWCTTREVMVLNAGDPRELRQKLEARDFSPLASLGMVRPGSRQFLRVYFQGCGDCDTTQTLSVEAIELTQDKKGKVNRKAKHIVKRLCLQPEETLAVATIAAELQQAAEAEEKAAQAAQKPAPSADSAAPSSTAVADGGQQARDASAAAAAENLPQNTNLD